MRRHALLTAWATSVLLGSTTAAAPYLVVTVLLGLSKVPRALFDPIELVSVLGFVALPIAVALPIVATVSLLVGLPLSWVMARWGMESASTYGLAGGIVGGVLTFLLLVASELEGFFWLTIPGSLSGLVTALSWWKRGRKPYL